MKASRFYSFSYIYIYIIIYVYIYIWHSAFNLLSFDRHKSPVVRVGSPPPVHKPFFPEMDRNRSNQVSVLTDPCPDNGGRNRQACHYRAMLELFFHQCRLKMERTAAKLMASKKKSRAWENQQEAFDGPPSSIIKGLLACGRPAPPRLFVTPPQRNASKKGRLKNNIASWYHGVPGEGLRGSEAGFQRASAGMSKVSKNIAFS